MDAPERYPADARRRRRPARWLAPLVFAAIALIIVTREVEPVRDWAEGVLSPQRAQARAVCREAALDAAAAPAFARVVARGAVHQSRGGYYVDGLVVSEIGESGAERRFTMRCYVDAAGRLARSARDPAA